MARRDVEIRVVGDADSAVKAFKDVDDAGAKTQSKFAGVSGSVASGAKAAFAGVGVGAVAAMGTELFKLGSDLESMRDKAEIVFGDQIDVVDKWAKKNAAAMGLTSREATGLATNMADLLIPMGMTREAAVEMSTKVIGLSGALSAWSGGTKTAAEVSDVLTAAMLGETDGLKALGISISAADIEQRLLEQGQKDLTGAARQQAEAQAVMNLILDKSKDAQTAFGDGVQSTNEKMATAKARVAELRDEMAVQFQSGMLTWFDMFTHGLDRLNNWRREWPMAARLFDLIPTISEAGNLKQDLREFFGLEKSFGPSGGGNWSTSGPRRFHSGGVVPGRAGAEVPAILQAGETVLTAAQMARLGSGAGPTIHLHAPNYVGDHRDLLAALSEAYARGGAITDGRGGVVRATA